MLLGCELECSQVLSAASCVVGLLAPDRLVDARQLCAVTVSVTVHSNLVNSQDSYQCRVLLRCPSTRVPIRCTALGNSGRRPWVAVLAKGSSNREERVNLGGTEEQQS